ncbi:thioesterase domain-containing protein [Pseudomonas aeruginosa]|nr:thioesterase domain-containing protein [Pseudomonas aeruginosa]
MAHASVGAASKGRWRYSSPAYPRPPKNDVSGYRRAKADAELVAALRDYRGTPEAVLNDPSLMQMLLPVVRADFLVTGATATRRMGRWTRRCTCSADVRTACAAPSCSAGCMRPGRLHPRPARRAALFIREQQGQLLRLLRRYAGQHLLRWHKDKVRGSIRAAS